MTESHTHTEAQDSIAPKPAWNKPLMDLRWTHLRIVMWTEKTRRKEYCMIPGL